MNTVQYGNVAITSAFAPEGGVSPSHGSVLRIIVENLFYPVTLDVLYQVIKIGKTNSKICFYVATIDGIVFFLSTYGPSVMHDSA